MTTDDQHVSCCFCGQSLQFKDAVEISFRLKSDTEEFQTVYAHSSCFDKTLHASVPRLLNDSDNSE